FEKASVRVPDPENKLAKEVHPKIREALKEELEHHEETFLSGSYSRRVQEGHLSDVDIIVVLKDPDGKYANSAEAALKDIQDAAGESDLVRRTRKRVRAVKVFLHGHVFTEASPSVEGQEFTVDLVAARRPASGRGLLLARHLPDEGYDDWQLLDPEGQRKAAIDKNGECGGLYIPAVRIVKHWNQGVGKPLRSYHAEAILWHALTGSVDYDEAVVRFFDAAYEALAPKARTTDPGDPDSYVDDRLEDDERAAARIKVEKARSAAHEAYEAEDIEDALEGWVKVFGSSFPAPSTMPERMRGILNSGQATAIGTGIQSGSGRDIIRSRSWRGL
ncbi:MAG: nucleotidyltransferase domain-containing protein, partial [Rubrobacteraceae bacterium]